MLLRCSGRAWTEAGTQLYNSGLFSLFIRCRGFHAPLSFLWLGEIRCYRTLVVGPYETRSIQWRHLCLEDTRSINSSQAISTWCSCATRLRRKRQSVCATCYANTDLEFPSQHILACRIPLQRQSLRMNQANRSLRCIETGQDA